MSDIKIRDRSFVPNFVDRDLYFANNLNYKLSEIEKHNSDNPEVQLRFDNIIDHIVLRLPFDKTSSLSEWKDIWEDRVFGFLKTNIEFIDFIIYVTLQKPDLLNNHFHCHLMLFDLKLSELNSKYILPSLIN